MCSQVLFARVIYHTSKHFYTCVGACACDRTPLLKRPAISDAYDAYDAVDVINEKPKDDIQLDKLHIAMKEKLPLCSYHQKIQLLPLVPDSWSQEYCLKYFDASEYLIRSARDF